MYKFKTCTVLGDARRVVYVHPNMVNFGLAVEVNRTQQQHAVTCHIMTGQIDGSSRISEVNDHTIPLDVQIWCFLAMRIFRDSVNMESIDLNTIIQNCSNVVYYPNSSQES